LHGALKFVCGCRDPCHKGNGDLVKPKSKPLSRMTRAELIKEAERRGVDLCNWEDRTIDDLTRREIYELIRDA
jgi:hypothetical protein